MKTDKEGLRCIEISVAEARPPCSGLHIYTNIGISVYIGISNIIVLDVDELINARDTMATCCVV